VRVTQTTARLALPTLGGAGTLALAALPVVLLAVMVYVFANWGGSLVGPSPVAPDALGRIDVERISFRPDGMTIQVINSGPVELTIAQVTVNDALWAYTVEPDSVIPRLGRATVSIPYPWLDGEPHAVKLVTSNGLAFTKDVAIATATPEPQASFFVTFALLGIYVGVVPIFLGLLWFPAMRRFGRKAMDFVLALTAGLLIFMGLDALKEAIDLSALVPGPFRGFSLVGIGVLGAFLVLVAVSRRTVGATAGKTEAERRLSLAYLIALGIGLHNLGEGLAIGAAYALGELALGAFLVIGFTLQNTTEGFGIVAPIARHGAALRQLAALGLIAGLPTILGAWVGGFTYSDLWATVFLAIGAGAIFQVLWQIVRLPGREGPGWLASPLNVTGILVGLLLMYATGQFVAA
jgi:zinc transporter, ZIP family